MQAPAAAGVKSPCSTPAPAQSLPASPPPALGMPVSFAAGDPEGFAGLAPGSLAFLAISTVALGDGDCGLPLPGLGVGAAAGELFLDPSGPVLPGAPWDGPGEPAVFSMPVPDAIALAGLEVRAQAIFVDAASGDLVLTDALELVVGP